VQSVTSIQTIKVVRVGVRRLAASARTFLTGRFSPCQQARFGLPREHASTCGAVSALFGALSPSDDCPPFVSAPGSCSFSRTWTRFSCRRGPREPTSCRQSAGRGVRANSPLCERRPWADTVPRTADNMISSVPEPFFPRSPVSAQFVRAYDMTTNEGLRFQKVRYARPDGTKSFSYRYRPSSKAEFGRARSDGWLYEKPPGADAVLFWTGLHVGAADPLYWVEGEKDALAVAAAGSSAVSHHGGAGKVSREQAAEVAAHAGEVWLAADDDPSGWHDVALRYRLLIEAGMAADRIRIVKAAVGNDVTDHVEAGHALHEMEAVLPADAQRRAKDVTPERMRADGYVPGQPNTYNTVTREFDLSGNPWLPLLRVVPDDTGEPGNTGDPGNKQDRGRHDR